MTVAMAYVRILDVSQPLPQVLKASEVAKALRVSEKTVYRWFHDGKLSGFRVGHSVRFHRAEVERLLTGTAA